ncbi:amidohydrolase [Lacicoccus alkaliphilus]|uniref:Aminobenzoyl-glutamate utilization protein A n=1 Tax=Lacicoccus alkaliphilus DSM 16010 TaxID=1123231 RepID=A0A1M7E468_9BACL|nr:amidohydrolase [Salinicoccus alkaliphilus]SHL86507.1 aminobenzoyl-glutamate utilization protein A [Salinicoccus alkaliphilus DSM 16010]
MKDLQNQLVTWRRDFHKHPELGFMEMRTASIVADQLEKLGFEIQLGREVMHPDFCMGKPDEETTARHIEWAKAHGAVENYLPYFEEGYTGVVGILDTGTPGPTVAFRVDMDALPVYESEDENHFPNQNHFRSVNHNMHACGHDVHTTIGLGLAVLLSESADALRGRIKLIFQPAEEGVRGARSMVEAGVADDVDYFIASHIGLNVPFNHFIASNNGFLASSKIDVAFKGVASHAGGHPEEGKNAMLAAASTILNLHSIPRHSEGATRINVGEIHAGSGRNIIPDSAELKVEIRGATTELNEYMKEYAEKVIEGAAVMHQVEHEITLAGEAISSKGSPELAEIMHQSAENVGLTSEFENNSAAGSEDATYFMEAVQKRGGYATYCIFGTDLAAGHHNEKFDVREDSMMSSVQVLFEAAKSLTSE